MSKNRCQKWILPRGPISSIHRRPSQKRTSILPKHPCMICILEAGITSGKKCLKLTKSFFPKKEYFGGKKIRKRCFSVGSCQNGREKVSFFFFAFFFCFKLIRWSFEKWKFLNILRFLYLFFCGLPVGLILHTFFAYLLEILHTSSYTLWITWKKIYVLEEPHLPRSCSYTHLNHLIKLRTSFKNTYA